MERIFTSCKLIKSCYKFLIVIVLDYRLSIAQCGVYFHNCIMC